MLITAEGVQPRDGCIEGNVDDFTGWSELKMEGVIGGEHSAVYNQLRIFLGDRASGPAVYLSNVVGPGAEEDQGLPKDIAWLVHHHRTPTFRIMLGDTPCQEFTDGRWLGPREFYILDANKRYIDPPGVGSKILIVFADRRGIHPVQPTRSGRADTNSMTSDELIAWHAGVIGDLGEGVTEMHTRDDQAMPGVVITTGEAPNRGGRLAGMIDDDANWSTLSDGSKIAGIFMGHPETGMMVMLSKNAPDVIEHSGGIWACDVVRFIFEGSCRVGEHIYRRGDFIANEAGSSIGEVVHGPEGSTQIQVLSDRRFWSPVDQEGRAVSSDRSLEIDRVLAPFFAGIPTI